MTIEANRYSLAKLRAHTSRIVTANRDGSREHYKEFDQAVRALDRRLAQLENQPVSIQRNVLMVLATRLFNHAYSAVLLSEAGLIHDAIGCERGVWETLAAYFLVSVDPDAAESYVSDRFPRPGDVRKRLETLGYPGLAKDIRGMFSPASDILHLSRKAERWNLDWTSDSNAQLAVGGALRADDHRHLLGEFFSPFLRWFATFHEDRQDIIDASTVGDDDA